MKNLIILYFCLFAFVGCNESKIDSTIDAEPHVDKLSVGISEFGFNALNELSNDDENILISPLSIHTALAMTLQGADNNTLDQMLAALEIDDLKKEEVAVSYKHLLSDLQPSNESTKLDVNNALISDDSRVNLNPEFEYLVNQGFNAEELNLDFNDVDGSVNSINNWAAEATKDRIPKVLEEIKSEEIMFIINALYFIGDWQDGFPDFNTYKGDFELNDGNKVQVDLMTSDSDRKSFIDKDLAVVDLPFKDGEYSMTYIVNEEITPTEFVNSIANENFTDWYADLVDNKLKMQRTFIMLPKHEVYSKLKLKETLQKLGMTDAFSDADFTSMGNSPLGSIELSRVLHDAFIKVDEKGVEGAAVTTVGVGVTSVPPSVFMNKPFFFILRHNETGVPIFMGIINDPSN